MDNDPRNNSAKCKPSLTFLTPLDLLPGVAAEGKFYCMFVETRPHHTTLK